MRLAYKLLLIVLASSAVSLIITWSFLPSRQDSSFDIDPVMSIDGEVIFNQASIYSNMTEPESRYIMLNVKSDIKINIVILSLQNCDEYFRNTAHYDNIYIEFMDAGYDAIIRCESVDKLYDSIGFYNTLKSTFGYSRDNVVFAMPEEYAPFDTDKYDGYAWWNSNIAYVEPSYTRVIPLSCDGECTNLTIPVYTFDILEHESHHLVCDCNFHAESENIIRWYGD